MSIMQRKHYAAKQFIENVINSVHLGKKQKKANQNIRKYNDMMSNHCKNSA